MAKPTVPDERKSAVAANPPSVSVIIPAFNEAAYLPTTIGGLRAAEQHLRARSDAALQILVVDNASTDRTSEVASGLGAIVVHETMRNIARVRNAGAGSAAHEVLIFPDADTAVPSELLTVITQVTE